MELTTAKITLKSMSPYSQSRNHGAAKLEKELPDAYDKRTWLGHAHSNKDGRLVIPAHAFHQALIAAAKYTKKQIPGQGKATWTAKFTSGILMFQGDIVTNITVEDLSYVDIYANSSGLRGSPKRVWRRYPVANEWQAVTEIAILDAIITQDIFSEIVSIAGLFQGLGRFRPENGGSNGRFKLAKCEWTDNRKLENVLTN